METGGLLLRTLFAYVFVLVLLRLSGKSDLQRMHPSAFVLLLIVGDLFDDLFWSEVAAAQFVVATGTLATLQLVVALGTSASPRLHRWIDGPVRLLVRHGRPMGATLRRERMNVHELERLLRKRGIPKERWQEIRSAVLEPDGRASALVHEWARPATRGEARARAKAME